MESKAVFCFRGSDGPVTWDLWVNFSLFLLSWISLLIAAHVWQGLVSKMILHNCCFADFGKNKEKNNPQELKRKKQTHLVNFPIWNFKHDADNHLLILCHDFGPALKTSVEGKSAAFSFGSDSYRWICNTSKRSFTSKRNNLTYTVWIFAGGVQNVETWHSKR